MDPKLRLQQPPSRSGERDSGAGWPTPALAEANRGIWRGEDEVVVCVYGGGGGDAVLKRKTCMGLRAACSEKEVGAPAHEPHRQVRKEGSSPPHAALAYARASLGCVFMTLQCPRGRAVPLGASSAATCRAVPGGRGGGGGSLCRFIPLTPPSGAGGWGSPWRACRPPGGGGGPMSRLSAGVPPAPGVRWLCVYGGGGGGGIRTGPHAAAGLRVAASRPAPHRGRTA